MAKTRRGRTPNRLLTDAFREIKNTKSRFISLLVLSALAVCFLAGLRATAPDMKLTADQYFDQQKLMDLRVVSTLALTDEDVSALAACDGVETAQGAYTLDAILGSGENDYIVKVHSLTDQVNLPRLQEGRMPEKPDELLVEPNFVDQTGLGVGDRVSLDTGSGDFADALHYQEFTIVGVADSPLYINMERGSSSLGTGRVLAFVLVPEDAFNMKFYTDAYLRLEGTSELLTYSDAYEELMDQRMDVVQALADQRAPMRREDIVQEANQKVDDARQDLEFAKVDTKNQLHDAKNQLDSARKTLDEGWQQYRDGQQELKDQAANANQQILNGQQELENAKQELQQGALDLAAARKELDQGWSTFHEKETEFNDGLRQFEEGKAQYEDGLRQYQDGLAQYEAGLKEYQDGQAEYQQGIQEYDAGMAALADARKQLDEGKQQLADGEKTFNASADGVFLLFRPYLPADITSSQAMVDALVAENGSGPVTDAMTNAQSEQVPIIQEQIAQAQTYLDGLVQDREKTLSALIFRRDELAPRLANINTRIAEIDTLLAQPDLAEEERQALDLEKQGLMVDQQSLSLEKLALDKSIEELQNPSPEEQETIQFIQEKLAELQSILDKGEQGATAAAMIVDGKKKLDQARKDLADGEAQYASGQSQLAYARNELANAGGKLEMAKKELKQAKEKLDDSQLQLEDAKKKLDENEAVLLDGKRQLDEGRQKLEDGERQYAQGQADLKDGKVQYEQGLADLETAKVTLVEESQKGQQKLEQARDQLENGERDYTAGLVKYQQAEKEAEEKILDAQDQIDKAQRDVDNIENCEWYLLDRNTNMGYVSYAMDADRMGKLASVFPMIFFLVAALVCLTTMTRMVEEQRIAIGGLKALGYSKGAIAIKYVGYGFLASTIGSLIGLAVGLTLVPWIICTAWQAMYTTGELYFSMEPLTSTVACLASIGTVTLSALVACFSTLAAVPAQLMRPKAPPMGKRILLERITPLWSRLSFNHKVTLRNLFRYKRRFWMTVIGIGGCAALIVTAFGLRDSLFDVMDKQYGELYHYTAQVGLVDKVTDGELRHVNKALEDSGLAKDWHTCRSEMIKAESDSYTMDGNLRVLPDSETLSRYVTLRHRTDDQPVVLSDQGAVVTEKLAELLDVGPGDNFTLTSGERRVEVKVADTTENYVQHYVYMSDTYYREVFGEDPVQNMVLVDYDVDAPNAQDLAARLVSLTGVTSLNLIKDTKLSFSSSLNSVDYAVVLIIVCAAALAFVVLYNLTNINITERMRELATLKVLGFYDRELSAYVYRENVILTFFGVAMGMLMGKLLHHWLILTVEIDMLMFGRDLQPASYGWAAVLTVIFSLVVNLAAHWKLKKLDMVESLKMVE